MAAKDMRLYSATAGLTARDLNKQLTTIPDGKRYRITTYWIRSRTVTLTPVRSIRERIATAVADLGGGPR